MAVRSYYLNFDANVVFFSKLSKLMQTFVFNEFFSTLFFGRVNHFALICNELECITLLK